MSEPCPNCQLKAPYHREGCPLMPADYSEPCPSCNTLNKTAIDRAHAAACKEIDALSGSPLWAIFADGIGAPGKAGALLRQYLIAGIKKYLGETAKPLCPSCNTYAPWHRINCAMCPPDKDADEILICYPGQAVTLGPPKFALQEINKDFDPAWIPTHWMPKPEGPRDGD